MSQNTTSPHHEPGDATAPRTTSLDLVANGRTLVEIQERIDRHALSETIPDVEGVMATLTPPDQLTWSGGYAWSVVPGPDGRTIRARTTRKEIREFYEWRTSLDVTESAVPALTDIRSTWYGFQEPFPAVMRDVNTGEVSRIIYSVALFTMDGHEGITSEIVWLRIDDVSLDVGARVTQWQAYLAALRSQDSGKLVDLMTPDVQGAVRDYGGMDPPFVAIHGADEMRGQYDRMFDQYEVRRVDILQSHIAEWFVFHELMLTLKTRDESVAERDFICRIAEYMPFDLTGKFQGRCGYGTELLPI